MTLYANRVGFETGLERYRAVPKARRRRHVRCWPPAPSANEERQSIGSLTHALEHKSAEGHVAAGALRVCGDPLDVVQKVARRTQRIRVG